MADSWFPTAVISHFYSAVYVGKVFVEWEGESAFNYYCLFPYDIYSVSINYEGQERTTMSGSDNFYEGTAPYILSGWWQYSSAS